MTSLRFIRTAYSCDFTSHLPIKGEKRAQNVTRGPKNSTEACATFEPSSINVLTD